MDQYGKRLLLVAAMFGLAALCASLPGKQTPQTQAGVLTATPLSAQREIWSAAQTEAPQTNAAEPTEAEETESAGFYVVLRTEPGRRVTLCATDGEALQTVTANERGDATFSGLPPGAYRVEAQEQSGEFWLWENASVTATSGMLWADGELLYLTDAPTVHLRLWFGVPAEQSGRVVTVKLTARDGTDYSRSLVAGSSGVYSVEFSCLPPGDYRVRIGGKTLWNLTLTDELEQEVKLGLPG